MLDQNSLTKFYFGLFQCTYHDVVSAIVSQSEITRDCLTIDIRLQNEGLSFLTKTLPRLGKSLDRALATGNRLQFQSFKRKKGTQLPAFCWTLFSRLFHSDGSLIKYEVSARRDDDGRTSTVRDSNVAPGIQSQAMALKALRQICYGFYKLNIPHTHDQEVEVCEDFIKTDHNLPESFDSVNCEDAAILRVASRLIRRVLANSDPLMGIPKHGPGSVATGEKSHQKHVFKRYYEQLALFFPYDEWFYTNLNHLGDELKTHLALESIDTGTAKVVLVPKDSRGPRLISCEPLEYQWIQQGLMSVLVDTLESHRWTKGKIGFTDQSINQRLALEGSTGPNYPYATLDMKEASDRVSLALVVRLFPDRWVEALYACRSQYTKLPDGRVVPLNKFAPMGSAVCFPVEALVFWALCVSAINIKHNIPLKEAAANMYVYGDDLICRTEYHSTIVDILPHFGLLLNADKCCTAGSFKESCGVDAFEGINVTPLRVKSLLSLRRKPEALASYVELSNALHKAGHLTSAQYIFEVIQHLNYCQIPVVPYDGPSCIAFVRPEWCQRESSKYGMKRRYNAKLQRYEVKGYAVRSLQKCTDREGWPLMLRYLAQLERKNPSCEATCP